MTTHARSPLGVAACGAHSTEFRQHVAYVTCKRCLEASRRLRAVQPKEVSHAPVAALPLGADVNVGNSANIAQSSGLNAVTSVDRQAPPTGVGAVFSAGAASTTPVCPICEMPLANGACYFWHDLAAVGDSSPLAPGVTVRKNPHAFAYAYSHIDGAVITFSKFADPRKPAWG